VAKITGSHLIAKSLHAEDVDTLFGVAGDHFLHLLDVLADDSFRMLDTRHESGAVHMADAYSRLLNRAGVALSTTPGHANAIPGLANATHSHAPVVNIAGSADSHNIGRGAMQEFDQVGVAAPVTKGAWEIPSVERIPEYISLAFRTALEGRQGPVHLTIPADLQEAEVDADVAMRYLPSEYGAPHKYFGDPEQVANAIELLRSASKPVILAGTGAGATAAAEELTRLVETTRIPIFTTDSARGLVPDDHEYSAGFGYLPLNAAAQRIGEADVVLLLGQKLDYTWGYGGSPPFDSNVKFIFVDPSPADIGRARSVAVGIAGDVGPIVTQLADEAGKHSWQDESWAGSLKSSADDFSQKIDDLATNEGPMHPSNVSQAVHEFVDDDTIISFDGGDYAHFFRASFKANKPSKWLYVSSFGMIGVSLPYALGAQAAFPDKRVICVTGDGSLGFNGMEIDTAVRHGLNVVTVVGNNSIWGIDWQIQKGLYGKPVWTDLLPTRFDIVAQGLGAHGEHVTTEEELRPALTRAFAAGKPALVNVDIDKVISPVAEAAISRKLGSHG
jgi:acetolactate synthase-1/2/3 large subunit